MLGALLVTLCLAEGESFLRGRTADNVDVPSTALATVGSNSTALATVGSNSTEMLGAAVDGNMTHIKLEDIEPIIWIHVPKTGTSFKITLVHSVCPDLPVSKMGIVDWKMNQHGAADIVQVQEWCAQHNLENSYVYGHKAYPPSNYHWPQNQHKVVMFMRSPKQRVLSGYFHNLHDCPALRTARGCPDQDQPCEFLYKTVSRAWVLPYAQCVSGCSTKMMVGRNCNDPPHVTTSEINLAVARMQNNVAFIGMTDQWDLSICLYHTMFGGECIQDELRNIRKSPTKQVDGKTDHTYPEGDLLWGFEDADKQLYEVAERKFNALLAEYKVTPEFCETRCKGGSFF